jgi:hypothetical protein
MTSEAGSKMVSRRRILPFFGLAAGSCPFDTQPLRRKPPAWRRHKRRGERVERRYERRGGQPASKQPYTRPAYTRPGASTKTVVELEGRNR